VDRDDARLGAADADLRLGDGDPVPGEVDQLPAQHLEIALATGGKSGKQEVQRPLYPAVTLFMISSRSPAICSEDAP
jgi:hypothetical protein